MVAPLVNTGISSSSEIAAAIASTTWLTTALGEAGVEPIEAVGKEFDPNFHNAVMHVEDDEVGENVIVEEFQKGYLYKDVVVRHSMVKVAN